MIAKNKERIVVVLPGGIWQAELVRFYKEKGHTVYVVNPSTSETTLLSDGHIKCDIRDAEATYAHIHSVCRQPYLVVSDQSDIACTTLSHVCRKFGLKYNDIETVNWFSSRKGHMYSLAERLAIPVAPFQECRDVSQVHEFFERRGGRAIILKPDDGTNSRGFRVVHSLDDIKDAWSYARKFSVTRTVIAQHYVEGDAQITVEGFCQDGRHTTLTYSCKGEYWNPSLTNSLRWPARDLPEGLMKRVLASNDKFVQQTGLRFGITHAEYILNTRSGEFWLNEIACRGGGFRIGREIIKLVTGFDTYEQMYGILTSNSRPIEVAPLAKQRSVILHFYTIADMESVSPWKVEQVKKIPGVFDFNYDFNRQSYQSDPANVRHSYGIYEADTPEAAQDIVFRVASTMRI